MRLLLRAIVMMRLELRCEPSSGHPDLAWLADLTWSLDEIYDFLLRAEISEQVGRELTLRAADLAAVVEERAVGQSSPIVHVREGSMIIELAAQLVDSTVPVQVLASLALLVKKGPELAAWPAHVKKAWYEGQAEAEQAKAAYRRMQEGSLVEVVEDGGDAPLETPPKKPTRRPRGRDRNADLPPGVRASPPLRQ
jgi:hypothetical protein